MLLPSEPHFCPGHPLPPRFRVVPTDGRRTFHGLSQEPPSASSAHGSARARLPQGHRIASPHPPPSPPSLPLPVALLPSSPPSVCAPAGEAARRPGKPLSGTRAPHRVTSRPRPTRSAAPWVPPVGLHVGISFPPRMLSDGPFSLRNPRANSPAGRRKTPSSPNRGRRAGRMGGRGAGAPGNGAPGGCHPCPPAPESQHFPGPSRVRDWSAAGQPANGVLSLFVIGCWVEYAETALAANRYNCESLFEMIWPFSSFSCLLRKLY